jgi:hypothetical protein
MMKQEGHVKIINGLYHYLRGETEGNHMKPWSEYSVSRLTHEICSLPLKCEGVLTITLGCSVLPLFVMIHLQRKDL